MGKTSTIIFLILFIQLCQRVELCIWKNYTNGIITGFTSRDSLVNGIYRECWKIPVPSNKFVKLVVGENNFISDCDAVSLIITNTVNMESNKLCEVRNPQPITMLNDVEIKFYANFRTQSYTSYTYNINYVSRKFELTYEVKDIECSRKDIFKCTEYNCIPKAEVCDGIKDCENGADEIKCERGISAVEGVSQARRKTIAGLKSKRSSSWGWHENTPRAVTALFLSGGATFNGVIQEEELMAKQTELKTSIALLKNPISSEQLSMFINALLVTCHDPRYFHGQNLVQRLKTQVESSENFIHPIAYLTLCNANSTIPTGTTSYLKQILDSDSNYPFIRDIQAFTVMAVSCYKSKSGSNIVKNNASLISKYDETIEHFKQSQLSDGSFGNNHTTSLIAQALISSGEEESLDWKVNATVKYLMKKLESSSFDFVATYLALPVLNGKSLADIAKVNCSANPRKHSDNLVLDENEYVGPKMRVQYSLYVGEEKDVIHTIWLRVPQNFTAFEVMKIAAHEDQKYMFEWNKISDEIYVFGIGKVLNDPEAGMFWLTYLKSGNSTEQINHPTMSADKLVLNDGDHLIMWFKKASL